MMSDKIDELAAALCKVQAKLRGYKEDSNNPFFKSKYGDLTSVWDAIRAPLAANGLAVLQPMQASELKGEVCVETILVHTSGQWVSGVLSMMPDKPGPQAAGSCVTYARRYSLAAMVGIAPEDDDANSSTATATEHKQRQAPRQTQTRPPQNSEPSAVDRYADIRKRFNGDWSEFEELQGGTKTFVGNDMHALDVLELLILANGSGIPAWELTGILEQHKGEPIEAIEETVDRAIKKAVALDEAKREKGNDVR